MSTCSAPVVMFLMSSLSGCNAECATPLVRVDSFGVQTMVTPRVSALWDHAFASIDADGYTTVSNALHFFDAFRNGDYSELAVWSGIRDLIIRLLVLRCFRQLSSRLLCLTRSTLKLVAG